MGAAFWLGNWGCPPDLPSRSPVGAAFWLGNWGLSPPKQDCHWAQLSGRGLGVSPRHSKRESRGRSLPGAWGCPPDIPSRSAVGAAFWRGWGVPQTFQAGVQRAQPSGRGTGGVPQYFFLLPLLPRHCEPAKQSGAAGKRESRGRSHLAGELGVSPRPFSYSPFLSGRGPGGWPIHS